MFDEQGDDQVNFKQFVTALSAFTDRASSEEKTRFAFKIYDITNDGFVSSDELFQVLKMMVGTVLTDEQLHPIVAKTIGAFWRR